MYTCTSQYYNNIIATAHDNRNNDNNNNMYYYIMLKLITTKMIQVIIIIIIITIMTGRWQEVGVYVRGAQSSLSGDRACMNESTAEGCAVCTRYTQRRRRAGRGTSEWVGGWWRRLR